MKVLATGAADFLSNKAPGGQASCSSLIKRPEIISMRTRLQENTHFRIQQEKPKVSHRELTEAVGGSVGGTYHVLKVLIRNGLIKLGNFTIFEAKKLYAYVLTPLGVIKRVAPNSQFSDVQSD